LSDSLSKNRTAQLEAGLGYRFKDQELLHEALTHRSYQHEHKGAAHACNERLEFLGDSVLGLIIVEHLFSDSSHYSESMLAKMKSYLVSEPVLAHISDVVQLGGFLFLGKGEDSTGGRAKKSILANALEAVLGAIYLDGGYTAAKEVIKALFREKLHMVKTSGELFDYKTELQERSQSLFGVLPEYKLIKQEGKEHNRTFTVSVFINGREMGTASGKRKKEAENLAAQQALNSMAS